MLFARLAAFALPILGAIASPVVSVKQAAAVQKRGDILAIVTTLQETVSPSIGSINIANGANILTADDATIYLNDILNCIKVANDALKVLSARDLDVIDDVEGLAPIDKLTTLISRQATDADLEEVGQVLASVIADITTAIEAIADDLKGLPVIAGLIVSINGGLKTILLGVQVVLVGVIQLVQGLLNGLGLGGLLAGLGLGDFLGGLGGGLVAGL